MKGSIFVILVLVCLTSQGVMARRASLHELLKRNKEVVATETEDTVTENENRRVLHVGTGAEQPNFVSKDVEDDVVPPLRTFGPEADVYQTPPESIRISQHTAVGDFVKDYSDPYTNIASAPSYSDPHLLAAVMSQADKANFRYPAIRPNKEPEQSSASERKSTNVHPERNEIQAHSLFPPQFQEFLDLPMHTKSQTTKLNPSNRPTNPSTPDSSNPLVIGGYANTNINGKIIPTQSKEKELNEQSTKSKPKPRITRIRHPGQKPTNQPSRNKFEPHNKQVKKEDSVQPTSVNGDANKPKPTRVSYDQLENRDRFSQNPFKQVKKDLPDSSSKPALPFGTKITKEKQSKPVVEKEIDKSEFRPSKPDPFFPPFQPINTVYLGNKPRIPTTPVQENPSQPVAAHPTTRQRPAQQTFKSVPQSNPNPPISRPVQAPFHTPNNNYQNRFPPNSPPIPWHPPPITNPSHFPPQEQRPSVPHFPPHIAAPPNENVHQVPNIPHLHRPNFEMRPPHDVPRQNNLPPPNLPARFRKRPQRKNGRPILRKRPSFLESFGFFSPWTLKRRRGETADDRESSPNSLDRKNGRYVLSNGPLPSNAQKVVVLGPFKKPPIGAPMITPQSVVSFRNEMLSPPSHGMVPPPPSEIKQQKDEPMAKQILPDAREPSFKVIHLAQEQKKDDPSTNHENEKQSKASNLLESENGLETIASSPKFKRKVDNNVVYGINSPSYYKKQKPIVKEVKGSYNVAIPADQKPLHLQQVSKYDKERIIAAKFYFAQRPSIRRVGMEKHVIPIPVPIMSPKGKQILGFQDIVVPKVAAKRRMNVSARYPKQKRLPFLKRNRHSKSKMRTPVVPANTRRFNPNILKRGFSGVFPQPESFIEPTVSEVNYGGWQAVGPETPQKKTKVSTTQTRPKSQSKMLEEKEKNMVRYSSKLKVEMDDDDVYIVNPDSNRRLTL